MSHKNIAILSDLPLARGSDPRLLQEVGDLYLWWRSPSLYFQMIASNFLFIATAKKLRTLLITESLDVGAGMATPRKL
ncbi:hypothetical protein [Anabaena sp. CCY 0017]|uniref:hypothetical protein n=1 Tax=Anabaena sp. CCY 0017 TaxID=3103866 RepID=UPI0039C74A8B